MAEIPMQAQLYMGRGVNSITGKPFGTAIEFDTPPDDTEGQEVSLHLLAISSSRELTETLNISASASFKKGFGGVSAEFSLVQSRQFNNYYTYAMVRCFVKNPPKLLRNPRLKSEAEDLLKQKGWDEFAKAYGWEYVAGHITGGSYYGLIEIQTINETEQQDIKRKLSGFYGAFDASVEVQNSLKEIVKNTTTNVFVTHSGGYGQPVAVSLEAMIEDARNFPAVVSKNPIKIVVLTSDYQSTVPLPQLPNQNFIVRIQQKNTLEDLGREYLKLRDYKANLEFVLEHLIEFDDFRELDTQQLQSKRQEYQDSLDGTANEIDEIVKRASNCMDDFGQCQTYAPSIQRLPLPKIGGNLMNLKQIEEHLSKLRQEVENLRARPELPQGSIIPWYTKDGSIPAGWAVCDGANGTPDLRGKFLMGTTNTSKVGETGDGNTVIGEVDVTAYAAGWDQHITPSPNGGPQANQGWGNQQWHRLVSNVKIPQRQFKSVPAYCKVIYIMKL
ncbi:hypothetical protein NIES22_52200 [Calothrix brevissima NIES-22]|nr:hypothetical protein NIES22_52200 [Calothrix brevissima NIES-22]